MSPLLSRPRSELQTPPQQLPQRGVCQNQKVLLLDTLGAGLPAKRRPLVLPPPRSHGQLLLKRGELLELNEINIYLANIGVLLDI